jgi:hypothetical protein
MSDYVPTTDEVRYIYTWGRSANYPIDTREFRAAFDAWLAAHDREVAEKVREPVARVARVLAEHWIRLVYHDLERESGYALCSCGREFDVLVDAIAHQAEQIAALAQSDPDSSIVAPGGRSVDEEGK